MRGEHPSDQLGFMICLGHLPEYTEIIYIAWDCSWCLSCLGCICSWVTVFAHLCMNLCCCRSQCRRDSMDSLGSIHSWATCFQRNWVQILFDLLISRIIVAL